MPRDLHFGEVLLRVGDGYVKVGVHDCGRGVECRKKLLLLSMPVAMICFRDHGGHWGQAECTVD